MQATMEKSRRHRLILETLSENTISSQEQLVDHLKSNKVNITQSTLSRDLKELRVTRVSTGDSYRYQPPSRDAGSSPVAGLPDKLREIASLVVVDLQSSDSVVAIRTLPGRAQGLASFLDTCEVAEIMATVAGDDTVIVFPANSTQIAELRNHLVNLLGL